MKYEFTAIIEKGEDGWWIASCAEVPGANGQGRTPELAREDLGEAIRLMLDCLRDQAIESMPAGATLDTVSVG